jgi:hypothetical protein
VGLTDQLVEGSRPHPLGQRLPDPALACTLREKIHPGWISNPPWFRTPDTVWRVIARLVTGHPESTVTIAVAVGQVSANYLGRIPWHAPCYSSSW